MISRQRVLIGLAVVTVSVVAAGVWIILNSHEDRSRPSTYYAEPEGAKALFLTLSKLNLPVGRLRKPFTHLSGTGDLLILIDPRRKPMTEREMKKLKDWVKRGNRLLLFEGPVPTAPGLSRKELKKEKRKSLVVGSGKFNHPGKTFGFRIERFPDLTRRDVFAYLPQWDDARKISVLGNARWQRPGGAVVQMAGDDHGPVLLRREVGQGSVTALSDPTFVTNEHLGLRENLALVVSLILAEGRPNRILFDEYHQGHIRAGTLRRYIVSSVFFWILAQLLIGFAAFVYTMRARRAGRFAPLEAPSGRSSLEHVESMANIFQSCKAANAALESIYQRFVQDVSARTGVGVKTIEQSGGAGIGPRDTGEISELSDVMEAYRTTVTAPADASAALSVARRMAGFRRRLKRKAPGLLMHRSE
jgi:hypothetical protein